LKVGLAPEILAMPLLPRPMPAGGNGPLAAATAEGSAPQVARVLRAVVENAEEEK
jgi:hypothetical protein